ncbi:MAG TPA: DUF177 domain-containing protein [Candidatus Limnocylindrales bacterium]
MTTRRSGRASRSAAETLTYNVAGLLAEPVGSTRQYHVAGPMLDLGADLRQADPLEGDIRLARTNRGLLVDGHLETAIEQECSRCLRDIEVPVVIDLVEEALPSIDIATGQPLDLSAEPDVLRLTDHHELELEPTVREAIQLAEPIAPLCREDCPGLCVVCGADLSAGPHEHPDEEVDPRLQALADLHLPEEPRSEVDGGPRSE